jgi:hypothetical protein
VQQQKQQATVRQEPSAVQVQPPLQQVTRVSVQQHHQQQHQQQSPVWQAPSGRQVQPVVGVSVQQQQQQQVLQATVWQEPSAGQVQLTPQYSDGLLFEAIFTAEDAAAFGLV